jgi:hypothetical protein
VHSQKSQQLASGILQADFSIDHIGEEGILGRFGPPELGAGDFTGFEAGPIQFDNGPKLTENLSSYPKITLSQYSLKIGPLEIESEKAEEIAGFQRRNLQVRYLNALSLLSLSAEQDFLPEQQGRLQAILERASIRVQDQTLRPKREGRIRMSSGIQDITLLDVNLLPLRQKGRVVFQQKLSLSKGETLGNIDNVDLRKAAGPQ